MKKTVGVLSLIVMLFTQIVTPYAYAVGDESPVDEVVTDEVVVEEPMVLEPIEDEEIIEENTPTEPENTVEEEIVSGNGEETNTDSGSNTELPEAQSGGGISCENKEILTGGEENQKEESEELSGAESSSGFFETIKEGVKNLLGIGETSEDEEIIESKEIYGTGEYEGVKVEVYAQTGLFESGTILTIEPVIEEKLEQVKEVLSGEVEMVEEEEEQTVVAFDITFRNPETQEEIQPKNGTVQVTFNYEENENLVQAEEKEEQEVKVYHLNDIDEEGNKIEEITGTTVEEVIINKEESKEDNVMVVEAEKFSIYAIIKGATNVGNTITITYNANGGNFKTGNNQFVEEIMVTYTKQSNGNYTSNTNLQAPNRSNYMFAGWYTTSSNQSTERYGQVDDTTENSKKVYAKWLSFNDSTFTVSGVSFTMMDRNLGATSTYGWNKESYGYYYQWGNNFGFKYNKAYSSDRNRVSNSNHAVSPWGPGNYYSNSIFIDKGNRNSNWDEENNGNLRGGIKTMNPDSDRQGPCPEGYHVPDRYERDYMLKLFFSQKNSNANYCGSWKAGECLFYKFNLPWAGYRYDPSSTDVVSEYSFMYWSSTPAPGDDRANKAYYFDMYRSSSSENVISSFGRGNANPIRCFKDSKIEDTHKLIFSGDNGENEIIYNMRWREPITEEYRPENPTNGDLGFLGWYPYDNGQYGNLLHFNKEVRINKDTVLKARWGETNPVYTYDANGGYFENGENEVEIEHQIDEGYYERIENLQIPNKTGYMFVGWYTTSGDGNYNNQTEEWIGQVDCEVQNTKRIYAKWLPFNDLTITMSGVTFTIMDRNLGAEEPAEGIYVNSNNDPIEDSKKLGFYYQWGNNYGFKNNLDFPKISSEIKDTLNNGPGNYYYSNIFISPTGGYSWSSNFNKNLWGGEKPLNSDEDKQGPCPKGYHIPDKLEWKMVSSLYEGGNTISEYCNGSYNGCLNRILKLPFMGQVSYSDMQVPYYFHSPYWSSSPSTNDDYAEVYWLSYAQGMAYGIPIRCFKNSKIEDTVPLIFSGDNGTDDIVYNMRWWEPVTKLYIPDEPVKDGYSFIGWYIYEDGKCGEPFDFAAEKILTEPLILKAKWGRQGQKFEYNANGGLFKNGNEKIEIEHEIINGRYEEKEYIGIPSRTGYMFAGWFIESGDYTNQITERENGWTPMHDISKKIYAKWLPFNDLTVTMSGVTFTIMDRNLGASAYMNQGGKQSSEWNGYYYQWGNNYGFKNSGNMRYVDDIRVDADVYDGDLFYYKNIFKKINSSYYRRTINNNKNLWGGGRDDNGDIDRQGPCPGGYHVPNQKEWLNVIDLFKTQKNQDSDFCEDFSYESDCFASKLKLPYAGYRDYLGRVSNGGSYRSSTATTYEDQSFYIYIGQSTSISDQRYNSYYRAQAYPIRCFKDSPKIVYHSNGGTIPRRPTNVLRNGDNKLKLSNSIRTGYTFEGWYKTIDLIEGTEVYDNNIPTNDDYVNVYARWGKNPWYIYNANGGSFSGENIQIIKYNSSFTSKNSHTPNLDDEGNKLSDYEDNLDLNEVITLEGANRLHITLTYGGESCCDYVAMWTGAYPDYKANVYNHYKTSFLSSNGYLYGGNHDNPENTKEYYVSGDTVTIAYHSDSSSHGDGYGYYAVISNPDESDKVMYYTFEEVIPERTGYNFLGWYETGATELFDITGTKVTQDRTLYAKWEPIEYTINYHSNTGNDIIITQGFVYDIEQKLLKNNYTYEGYKFLGWNTQQDGLGTGFYDEQGVLNLTGTDGGVLDLYAQWGKLVNIVFKDGDVVLTGYDIVVGEQIALPEKPTSETHTFVKWNGLPEDGKVPENVDRLEIIAEWVQNPPSAGGGQSITPTVKEEHEAAEEKQEDQEEQIKTPEKTNTTSSQSSTQQSSSSSKEITVTVDPEILSAYEWAYENNITTITSLDEANPDGPVTRGHLAKMVVNYATNVLGQEIPEKIASECRWNDWRGDWESEEIKDYAVKSCALGLMGLDMPKFLPNMQVTRAQFGTIMSRLLWGKKYAGGTPYYRKHLNALKENGIMTQIDNPEKRVELRQWVWLMLMRSAQNK